MTDKNVYEQMRLSCRLCARRCGVNRQRGEPGYCGAGSSAMVARASLHEWEEPCISGTRGSGTVFFSHCSLKCVFCQNAEISMNGVGNVVSEQRLAQIFIELQDKGAHNINLVTPTHFILPIINAVEAARKKGLVLPVVYNTSSYETPEAVRLLRNTADIYLADTKFFSTVLSQKYCNAPNYFEVMRRSVEIMFENVGKAVLDEDGMLQKGLILRLLLLPGQSEDAKNVLNCMFEMFGNNVFYSLMNQYTPCASLRGYPELQKTVGEGEYEELVEYAIELGIENGYIQQGGSCSESFILNFDGTGVAE